MCAIKATLLQDSTTRSMLALTTSLGQVTTTRTTHRPSTQSTPGRFCSSSPSNERKSRPSFTIPYASEIRKWTCLIESIHLQGLFKTSRIRVGGAGFGNIWTIVDRDQDDCPREFEGLRIENRTTG
ncbi:hypothetical protein PAXRUDRAFT_194845 [Paxillus rubicundulus Ve08.2h10]|uniref:Uncharacterized protein n=1 Tax=Paxillus rubicundulus Ve08.2h10 TaxID=930991 RepID=A0A0D0DID1_9AGAM|nr:hypothetical protein PAXRUDRAFT_194845 [Paxillus rubicundulus Ve08.2h10]